MERCELEGFLDVTIRRIADECPDQIPGLFQLFFERQKQPETTTFPAKSLDDAPDRAIKSAR